MSAKMYIYFLLSFTNAYVDKVSFTNLYVQVCIYVNVPRSNDFFQECVLYVDLSKVFFVTFPDSGSPQFP